MQRKLIKETVKILIMIAGWTMSKCYLFNQFLLFQNFHGIYVALLLSFNVFKLKK